MVIYFLSEGIGYRWIFLAEGSLHLMIVGTWIGGFHSVPHEIEDVAPIACGMDIAFLH